jgi:hypothetical protein
MASPTIRTAEVTSHAFSTSFGFPIFQRFHDILVACAGGAVGNNNIFTAGLGLMLVNAASSTIFSMARFIWSRLKHLFTVTFEITSRDESYGWMIEWLNAHPLSQHAPSISVTSTYYEYDEGDKRPKLLLVPNVGAHMLRFRGRPIWLSRTKEENYPDLLSNGMLFLLISLIRRGMNHFSRGRLSCHTVFLVPIVFKFFFESILCIFE